MKNPSTFKKKIEKANKKTLKSNILRKLLFIFLLYQHFYLIQPSWFFITWTYSFRSICTTFFFVLQLFQFLHMFSPASEPLHMLCSLLETPFLPLQQEGMKYWCVCVSCSVMSNSLCPIDCSLAGFSVHGILQARILVWIAIPFSRGSFRPRYSTRVSCIEGRLFTACATREARAVN